MMIVMTYIPGSSPEDDCDTAYVYIYIDYMLIGLSPAITMILNMILMI